MSQTREWVADAYKQMATLKPRPLPEMIEGVEEYRVVLQETRRMVEVSTDLLVGAMQRTQAARGRERLLRAKVGLLKRTGQAGAAEEEYTDATLDAEALKFLVVSIRALRENLRSAVHDVRVAAKLVADQQLREPNPGVRDIPERQPAPVKEMVPFEQVPFSVQAENPAEATKDFEFSLSEDEVRGLLKHE